MVVTFKALISLITVLTIAACDAKVQTTSRAVLADCDQFTPGSPIYADCLATRGYPADAARDYLILTESFATNETEFTLEWEADPAASGYHLGLASDKDCANEQISYEQNDTSKKIGILAEGTYFVCLFSKRPDGSEKPYANNGVSLTIDRQEPIIYAGKVIPDYVEGSFLFEPQVTDAGSIVVAWEKISGPGSITFTAKEGLEVKIDFDTSGTYEVLMEATDAAGNTATQGYTFAAKLLNDPADLPPTVEQVSSIDNNGTYNSQDSLTITVQFSKVVVVTGVPQLQLETGAFDAVINYTSGSGTDTLNFSYSPVFGHNSEALDYQSPNSLILGAATIQDTTNNNAVLTLPSPNTPTSLSGTKQLRIAPTALSIAINTGDGYTNTTAVSLDLQAPGALEMFLSDAADCSSGSWELYSASKPWNLSATNAEVHVYGKFKDADGNISACLKDNIIHDNTAFTVVLGSIETSPSKASPIPIYVTFNKAVMDFNLADLVLSGANASNLTGTGNSYTFDLNPVADGVLTVDIPASRITDLAGNANTPASQFSIVSDTTAPAAAAMVIAAGNTHTTTQSVIVSLTATDAYQMLLSNSSDCSSGVWETFAPSTAWTLSQVHQTAYIYAKFRDLAGNESVCTSDDIVHDNVKPTAQLINLPANPTSSPSYAVNVTSSSGVAEYSYAVADQSTSCAAASYSEGIIETTDITGSLSGYGNWRLCVKGIDQAGNIQAEATEYDWLYLTPAPNPPELTTTDGSEVNTNGTQTTLSWTASGGSTIGYRIAYRPGATAPADCSSNDTVGEESITGTSHTITALFDNHQYSFRLCSINSLLEESSGITTTIELKSWQLEVTTVSSNVQLDVGFDNAVNTVIDWGDGNFETINLSGVNQLASHTYASSGTYTLKIRGQAQRINFSNPNANTKITGILSKVRGISGILNFDETFKDSRNLQGNIPDGLFDNSSNVTSFISTFSGASGLTGSIPEGLFAYNPNVTSFSSTFKNASGITGAIPDGLFDNNTAAINFTATFRGASGLSGSIPSGLFDYNPGVINFVFTFSEASGLTGSIPSGLFDNNPSVTSFYAIFYNASSLTGSIPAGLFDNNPSVTSFASTFHGASGLTGSIPAGLFDNNPNVGTFVSTFQSASGLTGSIPNGLFDNNQSVTSFEATFSGASGLTGSIPDNLFDNNTSATGFEFTFYNASGLTGAIPSGLFDNNTAVTSFDATFYKASGLTGGIPAGLFDNNPSVTSFYATFRDASGLTGSIPTDLFTNNPSVTSFDSTFYNTSGLTGSIPSSLFTNNPNVTTFNATFRNAAGLSGAAPDLWLSFSGSTTSTNCFLGASNLANRSSIPAAWGGDGP